MLRTHTQTNMNEAVTRILWIMNMSALLCFRFVEYWAKIGSEENITLCHRPTCRKEGVLLDYSIDGGTFHQ